MPTLVFPAAVRDEILEQHAALRVLLKEAAAVASATLPPDESRLAGAARALHGRFHAHLSFEDEALKPVLAVVDSWGPERVRDLHVEHARQRQRLDDLLSRCDEGCDPAELALALGRLADELLEDMLEEEAGLARPEMSSTFLTIERR